MDSTNFARPIANAEYYLSSLIFGTHWNRYLLSNYFIESALVASVVHLSNRQLRFSVPVAIGLGFVCFVSPAFDNGALYSTSFAFDLLAALFVVSGLNQLLSGRLTLAWIFFAAALFTKETAFFAPFAASVVTYRGSKWVGYRRFLVSACFLLPYAAWGSLRRVAFRGLGGVYAVSVGSFGGYVLRVFKGFLRWPLPFEVPFGMTSHPRAGSTLIYVFATINLSFWIVILSSSVRLLTSCLGRVRKPWQAVRRGFNRGGLVSPIMELMTVFCVASIAILIVIPNLQPRFGATFVPLFALTVAGSLQAGIGSVGRTFAYLLLFVPPILNVTNRIVHLPGDLAQVQWQWAMASSYVSKISQGTSSSIYIVDDVSGVFSSTESVRKFAGYKGQLIRVNDLMSQEKCGIQIALNIQKISRDDLRVTSDVDPPCAGHAFFNSRMRYPVAGEVLIRTVGSSTIVYRGFTAEPARFLLAPGRLFVDIRNAPPFSALLVPDPRSRVYREITFNR